MKYKTTNQLFKGVYQYKVVLICPGASLFRSRDMASVLDLLKQVDITRSKTTGYPRYSNHIKSQEDLDYALNLQRYFNKFENYDMRIESPYISFYTNSKKDVDTLIKIDSDKVKYVCIPPENTSLENGTIILPKIPFEFKVTLGKTTQNHTTFIQWAEANGKIKITKSCKKELSRDRSWGGTYFYVNGDKNLLMAKMHLGGSINKVERIIKA